MQCAISVFRVLSGGDEVRALVTRLFPQGHNPTCQTGEFNKFNPFNVTGKIYHVTSYPVQIVITLRLNVKNIIMAQAKHSERERLSVLMMRDWGDQVRSYDQVRLLFNRTFRNGEGLKPVPKSTIERAVRRFMNHGSIKDL